MLICSNKMGLVHSYKILHLELFSERRYDATASNEPQANTRSKCNKISCMRWTGRSAADGTKKSNDEKNGAARRSFRPLNVHKVSTRGKALTMLSGRSSQMVPGDCHIILFPPAATANANHACRIWCIRDCRKVLLVIEMLGAT